MIVNGVKKLVTSTFRGLFIGAMSGAEIGAKMMPFDL